MSVRYPGAGAVGGRVRSAAIVIGDRSGRNRMKNAPSFEDRPATSQQYRTLRVDPSGASDG